MADNEGTQIEGKPVAPPAKKPNSNMPKVLFVCAALCVFVPLLICLYVSYIGRGWISAYDSPKYSFDDIPDLKGKVALVTGANTGIGFVTARELTRKGAKVIGTVRSTEKGEKMVAEIKEALGNVAGSGSIEYMELQLDNLSNIKDVTSKFLAKKKRSDPDPKVDMLVLNAGVMMCPFTKTAEGFENQFGTNHLGHFLFVKRLQKVLEDSKARVVVVSSSAHEDLAFYPDGIKFDSFDNDVGYDAVAAYGQSKLANVLFSNELALRLKSSGATSNSLHPGAIVTELGRHVKFQLNSGGLISLLTPLLKILEFGFMSPDMGALTQLYVATSPALDGVTGKYFHPIAKEKRPHPRTFNETLQKQLWEVSETLTKKYQ